MIDKMHSQSEIIPSSLSGPALGGDKGYMKREREIYYKSHISL